MSTLRQGFRVQTTGDGKKRYGVIVKRGSGTSWVVQWDGAALPTVVGARSIERERRDEPPTPVWDSWMEEI